VSTGGAKSLSEKSSHAIGDDALADLGKAEVIARVFAGFQKYLYQPQAA